MRIASLVRHPRLWRYQQVRRGVAAEAIAGQGIEVGALHSAFPVPKTVKVQYVDHLCTEQLRAEYPELADQPLVNVDLVDDGETLATVPDQSQEFVIASHFLEHCEDPVGPLQAHLRVLRPGGALLLALPDRRDSVDRHRHATTLEHIVVDHEDGGETSRADHYRGWAQLVDLPRSDRRSGARDDPVDLERIVRPRTHEAKSVADASSSNRTKETWRHRSACRVQRASTNPRGLTHCGEPSHATATGHTAAS